MVAASRFHELCRLASETFLHVELVASGTLYRTPGGAEFRRIEALRLCHEHGRVIASVAMAGLGDLQRAAGVLLQRVSAA